ncbi:MAG: M48 family metalloprotease [Candidatus Zipacnadales bacterium]
MSPHYCRGWGLIGGAVACMAFLMGCSDEDIERTIGKQTAAAIESTYRVVDDPLVSDYVNTMGHILVGHSKRQDIPYQFKVIDTDIVNAAAVPWGYVYMTTGLLEFVESEDELWAVTGHEIGHQVGRHAVKSVKESILLSLATILIGRETKLGADLADVGFDLLQLKHSREDEFRADDYATAVIYAAGYDPTAHTQFFQRLMEEVEKENPSRIETLFLTHPTTKQRIQRQDEKLEVAQTDPVALTQVGAGYARRARYAEAIAKLKQAVELDGTQLAARLLLADCYLIRGQRVQAAEQYAAVLEIDPNVIAAQEGLRIAQSVSPPSSDIAADPAAIAAAGVALTEASERVAAVQTTLKPLLERLPRDLRPIADTMQRSTDTLVALSGRTADLPEGARQLTLTSGLAVAEASESVYCLEKMGEVFRDVMADTATAAAFGETATRHSLSEQAVAILVRSAHQLQACSTEVESLAEELPSLIKIAEHAGRVAENAALRVDEAMRPGSLIAERLIAADSVKLSQQRSAKARERAREAAERADRARTRSLVAEINTAGIVLGPEHEQACDNLVAYYTQTEAEQAQRFRKTNELGLGEAALLLASAKSAQRPVESLLMLAEEDLDAVAVAEAVGANLSFVNLFLRFIADGLAKEATL